MPDEILKGIADNPELFEAVKAVFAMEFSLQDISLDIPNSELAEKVRARLDGRALVANAFREIEKYKTLPEKEEMKNPAR